MKTYKVFQGDNLDLLSQYPDNYFDSVVTDCPYGLGKEPNAEELMKDWIEKGYHEISGSGFMGKEWDAFVPQPIFWKEIFRVLKHGGHVLSFFGTRTYDWGVMAMRFAGFEVRDCIQWLYGNGFPKSHNISKAIDKMYGAEREVIGQKVRGDVQKAKENGSGYLSDPANRNNEKQFGYGIELITTPSTKEAKQWDGWGSALKPANEPIVLARKPLEKGLSIAENVLKWGTGALAIDKCRITSSESVKQNTQENANSHIFSFYKLLSSHDFSHDTFSLSLQQIRDYLNNIFLLPNSYNNFYTIPSHDVALFLNTMNIQILGVPYDCDASFLHESLCVRSAQSVQDFLNDYPTLCRLYDVYVHGNKVSDQDIVPLLNDALVCIDLLCKQQHTHFHHNIPFPFFFLVFLSYNFYVNLHNINDTCKINQPQGRFPANILLTHHPECECKGLKKVKAISGGIGENSMGGMGKNGIYGEYALDKLGANAGGLGDENGEETIEDWACHDDCPIKILDEQSGESKSTGGNGEKSMGGLGKNGIYAEFALNKLGANAGGFGDKGGASRFFHNTSFEESDFVRFQYVAKASKSERNKGLDFVNNHVTVKPISLCRFLVRLITPPNGIVLDPFCGSGTTGIACKLEGFDFIGMEQDPEYCKIAEARIENYVEEKKKPIKSVSKDDSADSENQLKLF